MFPQESKVHHYDVQMNIIIDPNYEASVYPNLLHKIYFSNFEAKIIRPFTQNYQTFPIPVSFSHSAFEHKTHEAMATVDTVQLVKDLYKLFITLFTKTL